MAEDCTAAAAFGLLQFYILRPRTYVYVLYEKYYTSAVSIYSRVRDMSDRIEVKTPHGRRERERANKKKSESGGELFGGRREKCTGLENNKIK